MVHGVLVNNNQAETKDPHLICAVSCVRQVTSICATSPLESRSIPLLMMDCYLERANQDRLWCSVGWMPLAVKQIVYNQFKCGGSLINVFVGLYASVDFLFSHFLASGFSSQLAFHFFYLFNQKLDTGILEWILCKEKSHNNDLITFKNYSKLSGAEMEALIVNIMEEKPVHMRGKSLKILLLINLCK